MNGLKKLADSEIITRVMEAKAMSLWGGSKEATKLEEYITAARAELASRGVEIKLEAQEVFKSPKKEAKKTPIVVPSPSEIINGKSVEGLPNT